MTRRFGLRSSPLPPKHLNEYVRRLQSEAELRARAVLQTCTRAFTSVSFIVIEGGRQ